MPQLQVIVKFQLSLRPYMSLERCGNEFVGHPQPPPRLLHVTALSFWPKARGPSMIGDCLIRGGAFWNAT